jgi:hypothetical protein
MVDLITALGLAIAIEGVLYALFPEGMRKIMVLALSQPPSAIRVTGLGAAVVGVVIVWLVRG